MTADPGTAAQHPDAAHTDAAHNDVLLGHLQELRRGTVAVAALAALHVERYGYQLIDDLATSGITVGGDTLYPLLRRLERQGLLTSEWNTDEARPRKFYVTTAAGRSLLAALIDEWHALDASMRTVAGETPNTNTDTNTDTETGDAMTTPTDNSTDTSTDSSTDTLTDRYVWAVLRNLPDADRTDVDLELRELIGEMIDERDRTATPSTATDAAPATCSERQVLAELGDPRRLAARYVTKPRVLIGAQLFPEYIRILKLVWTIAFPIVVAVALVAELLDEDPSIGGAIGAVAAAAYGSTILVAFWVTVVYAALERSNYQAEWSLDDLPTVPVAPAATISVAEGVFSLVTTVATATLLVWQQVWPPLDDATGAGVPVLDPDIWNGAAQALLLLLGASFVVTAMVLARRRWTFALASANAVVNAASLAIVTWLALDERLINDEFLFVLTERADFDTVPTINPWLIIALIGAIEVWDTVDAFRKARHPDDVRTSAATVPASPPS